MSGDVLSFNEALHLRLNSSSNMWNKQTGNTLVVDEPSHQNIDYIIFKPHDRLDTDLFY